MLAQLLRHLNIIVLFSFCYASPLYEFSSLEQEQHYYEYIGHIRCLVCQNESIKNNINLQKVFETQLMHRDADFFCPEPVHPNRAGHIVIADALLAELSD